VIKALSNVRRFNLRLWCWLGVVLLVQVLAACSRASQSTQVDRAASSKDEIVVDLGWQAYEWFEKGFDPTRGWARTSNTVPLFQSTLLRRNESLELVNDLVQSYSISPDRKVWTVKIRQDARFTDGHPLTAADVAYTFNTAKASGGLINLDILDRAVAISDYEVELRLKQPHIAFIEQLVNVSIIPEHAHGKDYSRNPIGSGPYRLLQWNEGEQIIIEANPNYYGKPPKIKRIIFLFSRGDAALAAARSGLAQIARVPYTLATQPIAGMELHQIQSTEHAHVGLMFPYLPSTGKKTPQGEPIGNDVTADRAIRQAVNYAIDRQTLVNAIVQGYGSPATGPASGMPWEEPAADITDADPNRAKQILSQAGWRDTDKDGILDKQGLKAEFTLLYFAEDSIRQGLALAVAQMLKPVGIQVNVEGKGWPEIERRLHSNVVLYLISTSNPKELHFLYHSSSARGEYENPGYYSNPAVDEALDRGMAAASEAEAIQFWKQVQWDGKTGVTPKGDAASAWLVNLNETYLVSKCLDIGKLTVPSNRYLGPLLSNITDWKWVCD